VQSGVLSSPIPNAFALPGGKIYVFDGLLAKADNADEIAGVLAHELGHLKHRDSMRGLIRDGSTSFLIGLLFGDITGSSALIFGSRTLVTSSHSREAERTPTVSPSMSCTGWPAGEAGWGIAVSDRQGRKGSVHHSSHPLTEDRLARMSREDRQASGPPLLTNEEWRSLKSICNAKILIGNPDQGVCYRRAPFRDCTVAIGAGAVSAGFKSHTACMAEKACEMIGS
jgi:hypothetical protein